MDERIKPIVTSFLDELKALLKKYKANLEVRTKDVPYMGESVEGIDVVLNQVFDPDHSVDDPMIYVHLYKDCDWRDLDVEKVTAE